ncbi:MAG TPA: hypothetical protein VOA78_07660 [Candidatus Dormibacteraeota bacterium]|nr:hypothetical protein [Candidatus Dormibacteraeota bacterium]
MSEIRTGRESCDGWRTLRAAALAALIFVAPVIAAAAPVSHKEVRLPRVDRRTIENLQRWVNGGHDGWCKDAREVASAELQRVAPEFSGERFDLASLPAEEETKSPKRAVFTWGAMDGGATYRVTVERYDWLKQVVGSASRMVWVPSRVEIIRTERPAAEKRIIREIPRA